MMPNYSQPPGLQAQYPSGPGQGGTAYPPAPYPYLYPSNCPPPPAYQGMACPPRPNGMAPGPTQCSDPQQALNISDFDRMVRHQDFGKVLSAAARLKTLQKDSDDATSRPGIMNLSLSNLHCDKAAKIVRDNASAGTGPADVIPRGAFPHTDTLVDEAIDSLTKEFDRCLAVQSSAGGSISSETGDDSDGPSTKKQKSKKKKGRSKNTPSQSIAIKYSKKQTDILTEWMIQNKSHPFPDQNQIKALADATDLTYSQVVNWTTNVRKRNLKATVDHGKKPHHFLDFLFLADDREKRLLGEPFQVTKEMKKSSKRQQSIQPKSKSKAKPKSNARSKSAPKSRAGKKQAAQMEMPPLSLPPSVLSSSGRPIAQSHLLPPPLPKSNAPFQPLYRPMPYPPNAPYPTAGCPPSFAHPYPQIPAVASAQPLPRDGCDAHLVSPTCSGSGSPPPQYGPAPTEYRRATGDSLDEALNFWNSGLFSADDIDNDAALTASGSYETAADEEDHEAEAIQKLTEGGIVATPPHQMEESVPWIAGEEGLKSPSKRGSISDAAMLPMARNEKARRMSERNSWGAAEFWSAGPQQLQSQQQHPAGNRSSFTDDQLVEAMSTPLPIEEALLDNETSVVGV